MTPVEALLKAAKHSPHRTMFVTSAYAAAHAWEETGNSLPLIRWAEDLLIEARILADAAARREARKARRAALLWRLHLYRPRGTTDRELEAFLDDLRRRKS